ncbi:MAG: 3,4-dihydroxy-2-butanone-4-phosphate synthase [Solirubrobacterales bacterium]
MRRRPGGVEAALAELRRGRMVVVCDGEGRESEGDLLVAAQFATAEAINFMAKEARGLICLALSDARCDELGLTPIGRRAEAAGEGGFMVSIEAREGVTTGISAPDRARTVEAAIDPGRGADDLVAPGHVFPLRARSGGVLARAGHTEAAVDLAALAGLRPAGVICEILNPDGTMARGDEVAAYADRHGLALVTVPDLIAHRRRVERPLRSVFSERPDLSEAMRAVMGRFATGVTVVTAREADGEAVGTTVNAVSSVSLRPPLLLVCLARDSLTLEATRHSDRFALNVLAADQRHHSVRFAAKGADARAEEVEFDDHEAGVPVLPGSLATVACRVEAIHPAGDHEIVVGEVLSTALGPPEVAPLLFFRGSYAELAEPGALSSLAAG